MSGLQVTAWPSPSLPGLIKLYVPKINLYSADKNLPMVSKIRTNTYGAQAFVFAAPSIFNSLPVNICHSLSYDTFKGRLKTDFFQAAYCCK